MKKCKKCKKCKGVGQKREVIWLGWNDYKTIWSMCGKCWGKGVK